MEFAIIHNGQVYKLDRENIEETDWTAAMPQILLGRDIQQEINTIMDNTKTFIVHADPGHAWMQVHRALIDEAGVASQISGYSYQSGDDAFLEEDCDMSRFLAAYKAMHPGQEVLFTERFTNHDSPIRSYTRFTA